MDTDSPVGDDNEVKNMISHFLIIAGTGNVKEGKTMHAVLMKQIFLSLIPEIEKKSS